MRTIRNVLVVGAGVMGHGIAQTFSQNSMNVTLVEQNDELLEQGRQWMEENLHFMVELGELEADQVPDVLERIRFETNLVEAAKNADYVLEAITENLSLKKDLFKQLGEICPQTVILATNTSSYDIDEFSNVTKYPERVIGTHWFHPPPITPCVEVIPAKTTSRETIETAVSLMERIGKSPTMCKNAPGFVANRIQFAMAAEALAIVEEGLATPREVDNIVKSSFGFRLSAYGPFEIGDQAGLDTYKAIFEYLHGKLKKEQFKPPQILDTLMRKGRFGLKNQKGFYEYEGDAAQKMKRDRDRKLYNRLKIFREEQKRV